jgi:hypothetical protein
VIVVGFGPGPLEIQVHNSAMEPDVQRQNTSVQLTLLGDDFVVGNAGSGEPAAEAGYYGMAGPGLPFSAEKASAAVMDAVLVFKLKK